jgi:hypothetical protein
MTRNSVTAHAAPIAAARGTGPAADWSAADGRRFGFTVGSAFGVLGTLVHWRGVSAVATVFLGVAGVLLLAALIVPRRLQPVQRAWMRFALLLSKVTTPVFMGIVYFLVVTPTGLLMRAVGRNPMRSRRGRDTYWIARSDTGGRGGMENQF